MLRETFLAETARALYALFFRAFVADAVPALFAEGEIGLMNPLVP
jgi:hypothetical protein